MTTYRGIPIHVNARPGCALRYSALGIGAAATLANMRRLIDAKLDQASAGHGRYTFSAGAL